MIEKVRYHLKQNGRRYCVTFDLVRGRVTIDAGDAMFEHSEALPAGLPLGSVRFWSAAEAERLVGLYVIAEAEAGVEDNS
jgi:hypothetical protein